VLFEGISRLKGIRQKQAPAFTLLAFKRIIRSIEAKTRAGLRDRMTLLPGFTGAFRRSELTALNIEDLAFLEEGLLISLAKNKTNQFGAAEEKTIFYSPNARLCLIRTLRAWLARLDRVKGPVFVSFRKMSI